jgi:Tfp pilus assembly protein PilN
MAFLYLLLLIWGAGDLLIRRNALKKIRAEIAGIEAAAQEANNQSQKWRGLRSAIDPTTYALDLLAAVATPTEGGKVRLTRLSLEQGRLQLSGEATDVTQAYGFIEQLKKNPLLRDYDWNAGQPQLAGKNSVRFDMEGTKSDATTGTK